jgi:hypothetical protein
MRYVTMVYDAMVWTVTNWPAIREVVEYYSDNRALFDDILETFARAGGYGDNP